MTALRIGLGYDAHKFTPHRPLRLGGITIPHSEGLAGHSDADVLLHALCDALLGAAGLGDIGQHFPPEDPAWKDKDSRELLHYVLERVRTEGWKVINVDTVLIAQKPRLSPYYPAMRASIAELLAVPLTCVGIKASTPEQMGALGRGEGIAAYAVVLLSR
ncbi:MAG: 2-C-methyl-D-erythritol 2,4-cyclodiphosphate synthase [Bacteroidia bacterium]|nr:2-C-methyl-D-erythritol 2,4-cyclodiphosphate synthase [Bacteroidia bacterium]MDW8088417.1 2-C-methyl-D-erythritol 2,4-cyclodiphosphate synthase [Bacteroidia bacterium]